MASRSSRPSVTNLIFVSPRRNCSSNRTAKPTSVPRAHPRSSATRAASIVAAIRLGCVQQTARPCCAHPASARYCGSCVLFPLPVSAVTITTPWVSTAYRNRARAPNTGSTRLWRESSKCATGLNTASVAEGSPPSAPSPTAASAEARPQLALPTVGFRNALIVAAQRLRARLPPGRGRPSRAAVPVIRAGASIP